MGYYFRNLYPSLKEHFSKKQVTLLTGLRRTGKTTLVKQLIEEANTSNKIYLDFENSSNRGLFSASNYDDIIFELSRKGLDFSKKVIIAIDEVQLLPEASSTIKYLYDTYDVKFIITGSSSYYLKNLYNESLAGRKKIFELFPLDFGEYLHFNQVKFTTFDFTESKILEGEYNRLSAYYNEYIRYGGFPEVVLSKKTADKEDILNDILSSYINIDVRVLSYFRNEKSLYNLIRLMAASVGSKIDYTKISKILNLSLPTVHSYIDFLEKTYLIKRVEVISNNAERQIVKAQKVYFVDNGLANVLGALSSGAMFENAIFNQLKFFGEVNYFSLKTGKELDFVLNKKFGFEIKETPQEFDLPQLTRLSNEIGVQKGSLIGRNLSINFRNYIWGGDIRFAPEV
jgi:hypothetical protein